MLRRSHKKSRKGAKCLECSRRHIRCDQQRPTCVNCLQADRTCRYKDPAPPPPSQSSSSRSNQDAAASGPDSASPSRGVVVGGLLVHGPGSDGYKELVNRARVENERIADNISLVNITHLELFYHFGEIAGPLFVGENLEMSRNYSKFYLEAALTETYLAHQMLAFAAKHKSRTGPEEQSKFYDEQTTRLQTQALVIFRLALQQPPKSHTAAIATMRFSNLLGTHLLCDTLATRHMQLDTFLVCFDDYLRVHRGVRPIFDQYKSYLLNSDLKPILMWGWEMANTKGTGPECEPLREMLSQRKLESAHLEPYIHAVDMLQNVIDKYRSRPTFPGPAPWATIWLSGVKPKYEGLLIARQPEALAIFAYYGAMIHCHHRDLWLVGESGKHIIELTTKELGPEWTPRLKWPLEILAAATQD
ncbi:hypothetical protein BJ166DRAFT_135296 [Pestalotiopsis sp. NC0098]|nr:hypothetical protein BJ166DRAFT_135296 [Pestalotiopsis sp. NC0098]